MTPRLWSRERPQFVGDYQRVIKYIAPKCLRWFIMCYLRVCLAYFQLHYNYYYLHNFIIIYITNNLCNSTKYTRYLFADYIKISRSISSAAACTLLQSDIDSILGWCAANRMKLNIDKTRVITFTRKSNSINYNYKLCDKYTTRTQYIKRPRSSFGF